MEVIAQDDKGMQLYARIQAGVDNYLQDQIFFGRPEEQTPMSSSVPDMVGVVIADGPALGDAHSSSARIGAVQTILLDQPTGKSMAGLPVLGVQPATSHRGDRDRELSEALQEELFARRLDEEIQVVAETDQVTEDEVGRVVQVALVALKTSDDFLKEQIGSKSGGQAAQADAVAGKPG
jgi:hypothetical protein